MFARDSDVVQYICKQDPEFVRLADAVGDVTLSYRGDPFSSLVRSIIGQQVSGRSAVATWERLIGCCVQKTPKANPVCACSPGVIDAMEPEELKACGLSRQKIAYVKDLSQKAISGEVDFEKLQDMSDEEIVETLTKVRGIGVWTAKMYMIFTLGRFDVFAGADLGLRKGAKWLYRLDEVPKPKDVEAMAELWKPCRTVASLYLWQVTTQKL